MPLKNKADRQAYNRRITPGSPRNGGTGSAAHMKKAAKRINAGIVKVVNANAKYQRNSRIKNPRGPYRFAARARAKKSGLPCNITVEGLNWPTHCRCWGLNLAMTSLTVL